MSATASHPAARPPGERLVEIDALRGIAAVLVMLFHYTTRYDEIFVHATPPAVAVPWGYLGVNLFFMISGFVIFMTLDRTRHPLDFVVSRFSRLYPAYWVAMLVTFVTLMLIELPGKSPDLPTALGNLLMFHNLLGIAHVDNVYWTLEVELLFYAWMLALWAGGGLRAPFLVIAVWLGLRLSYLVASHAAGIDLPYLVSRVLILDSIPYFAIGMAVYLAVTRAAGRRGKEALTVAAALVLVAWSESVLHALVTALLAAVLYGAARQRLAPLRRAPLVWLGAISYPLYLLHENMGWAVLLELQAAGWSTHATIVAAIALAVGAAAALHYGVELPAMRAIRRRYRAHRHATAPSFAAPAWIAGLAAAVLLVAGTGKLVSRYVTTPLPGSASVALIQPVRGNEVPCRDVNAPEPLVLLVLGQSNAGNHGEPGPGPLTRVFVDGACRNSADPLPGATGDGGSIWTRLAGRIATEIAPRRVVIVPLAVDATAIATWTEPGPLRERFETRLQMLRAAGLHPAAVLWQQGEADARLGTAADKYLAALARLRDTLHQHGVNAPLFVARSTYCRGDGRGVLRRAIERAPDRIDGIEPGADTDTLVSGFRYDDCHFNRAGLEKAAELWHTLLREREIF